MRIYDIIDAKRQGKALSDEEIAFFVEGFTAGQIPDYQAAALLMAICLRGMDRRETATLTGQMAQSGDLVDLSAIPGVKVDKHSTGGVGDKTSLIVCPIVAACGVPVAKMSGRGLGHTGGTVDKLESIPGLRTEIGREDFLRIVNETGIAIIGQSGNIAPADKKIYALRDVTATVESLPLIASSIMSKKIAAGADAILLDVKTGSGAFMKDLDSSIALAETMVSIGEELGRKTAALITNMDVPLGNAIGNALEIIEVVEVLRGGGPQDLVNVCVELAANMLLLAGKGELEQCRGLARQAIGGGSALAKLRCMIQAQQGDPEVIDHPEKLGVAPVILQVKADRDGFIRHMDTRECGIAAMVLGAGRTRKEDAIDYLAGVVLRKKTGDRIAAGEVIAELHTSDERKGREAMAIFNGSLVLSDVPVAPEKHIFARVTDDGVEKM